MKKGFPQGQHFDETETWPEERLKRFQWQRVKRVLTYAYHHLPFYRSRFEKAGVHPRDITGLHRFEWVPIFTKAEVIQAMEERQSFSIGRERWQPLEPATLGMTSGTLGTTFLYFPRSWRRYQGESLARAYWWAGLRPGMGFMTAAPAWHGMAVQESYVVQRLRVNCVVPWGTFLPQFAPNFLDTLLEMKPQFLSLFLPMLFSILAECRRRGMAPRKAFRSVKYVLVVGAPLTPGSRERLKEELGVMDIFEGAGNPEGLIAMECSYHQGHHVFVDACYVEVVDPRTRELLPPGKRGSIVLTSLNPYGSLHIRYDTEDLGEILPKPCPCGRTWPRLEIYDRQAHRFQVGGKELVPYDVRLCLDEVPELVGTPFAVIRGEKAMPCLRLAIQKPTSGGLETLEARVRAVVQARLGIEVHAEWVEELPLRWKGATMIEEKEWRSSLV